MVCKLYLKVIKKLLSKKCPFLKWCRTHTWKRAPGTPVHVMWFHCHCSEEIEAPSNMYPAFSLSFPPSTPTPLSQVSLLSWGFRLLLACLLYTLEKIDDPWGWSSIKKKKLLFSYSFYIHSRFSLAKFFLSVSLTACLSWRDRHTYCSWRRKGLNYSFSLWRVTFSLKPPMDCSGPRAVSVLWAFHIAFPSRPLPSLWVVE